MGVVEKLGNEFTVGLQGVNDQSFSSVSTLWNGNIVVTWLDESTSIDGVKISRIWGQILSPFGVSVDDAFLINEQPSANASTPFSNPFSPVVSRVGTGEEDDGFVVTWIDITAAHGDGSYSGVKAQAFDADGSPKAPSFVVNEVVEGYQGDAVVTGLKSGGFAIAFYDASIGLFGGIKARIYDTASSQSSTEFLVALPERDVGGEISPSIAALDNGNFVVTWQGYRETIDTTGYSIGAQIFNINGEKVGGEIAVDTNHNGDQAYPSITGLAGGGFVVTWEDTSGTLGDADGSIKAQVFGSDGVKVGSEFLVNSTTDWTQNRPTVSSLPNGGFVVAWQDFDATTGDPQPWSVKAQVYDATGNRIGNEFLVNTTTAFSQTNAVITALADGRFFISWTDSAGADGVGGTLKGQIFGESAALALSGDLKADIALHQNYVLTSNDIGASHADANAVYTVSNSIGGIVSFSNNMQAISTFTQADLDAGRVIFAQRGSVTAASFEVAVSDSNETTGKSTFSFNVSNQAPQNIFYNGLYTAHGYLTYDEMSEQAWNLQVTDPEGETNATGITWSIVGGADKNAFKIGNGRTGGLLELKSKVDYEKPTDFNKDHIYDVVVRATDSMGAFTENTLAVRVNDLADVTLVEGADRGTVIGIVPRVDWVPGLGKFELADGEDRFAIDQKSGAILVNKGFKLDFEQESFTALTVYRLNFGIPEIYAKYLINIKDVANEVISADGTENRLVGGAGNDRLSGLGGDDILLGGNGKNRLDGGKGNDSMTGGDDSDIFVVDSLKDIVVDNGGRDTIEASISYSLASNRITGSVENLTLTGSANIDATGSKLQNTITGNSGDNRIQGGAGADILSGGPAGLKSNGADEFVFKAYKQDGQVHYDSGYLPSTRDVILDFGPGDKIDVSGIDAIAATSRQEAFVLDRNGDFRAGEIRQVIKGKDLVIEFNMDNDASPEMAILLVKSGTLDKGDFML